MSGSTMTLHREEQRAVINGKSKVIVIQPPEKPGDKENFITVHSDDAEFDYLRNYGDFKGNVVIDDPRMQLKCANMRIDLKELPEAKAALPKEAESTLSGMPSFDAGSKRELDRVSWHRAASKSSAAMRWAGFFPGNAAPRRRRFSIIWTRIITMTGDNPTLTRNADSLSGRELQIWVDGERICARDGSKVVLGAVRPVRRQSAAAAAGSGADRDPFGFQRSELRREPG